MYLSKFWMSCYITQYIVFIGEGREPDLMYFRVSADSEIKKNTVVNGGSHSTFLKWPRPLAKVGILQLFITLLHTQNNPNNKTTGYLFLLVVLMKLFHHKDKPKPQLLNVMPVLHVCWSNTEVTVYNVILI